jgi:hypothetical protein
MNNWVRYEDSSIYDGWILEFCVETKEIKWREHPVVEKLSKERKEEIEKKIKNYFVNQNIIKN